MVNAEPEKSSLPATVASTMIDVSLAFVIVPWIRSSYGNLTFASNIMHSSNSVFHLTLQPEDSEWNDFWNDVNGPSNPTVETSPTNIADEESKIKPLIDTPALDCQW
jgi:hypothetical protein